MAPGGPESAQRLSEGARGSAEWSPRRPGGRPGRPKSLWELAEASQNQFLMFQNCQFDRNYSKCALELDSHRQSQHVPVPGSPWRFLNSPCSNLIPVPMDTAVTRSVFNVPYPSGIHGVLFLAIGFSGSWTRLPLAICLAWK